MKLVQYTDKYQHLMENYFLSENQLRFTRPPMDCIKNKEPAQKNVVMIDQEEAVTFFTLDTGKEAFQYSGNKQAVLIRSFSTDYYHQGRGYAKQALEQLPGFLATHFPTADELVLGVYVKNHIAQGLYHACGFQDTEKRCEGRNGQIIIMNQKITANQKVIHIS